VRHLVLGIALFIGLALGATIEAAAESPPRIALVIGNGEYTAGRLANAVLDARSMAETLRTLGFEVLAHENAGYRDMRRALAEFGDRLRADGVGLFYYAGHGLQVNGKNYLVPVDAEIKSERHVSAEAVDAESVLAEMQAAKTRVNIVILDACRDNPFVTRFRGLGGITRGLAFMPASAGTYVAYATGPGSVAEDGEPGRNGIYTGELLKALKEPGLRIEDVFKRVRIAVQARTENRQNPWDASSMTGDFFFTPPPAAAAPPLSVREEVRHEHGVLAVTSSVDGVEVFVNGQRVGEARRGRVLVIDRLAAGAYHLVARRAGYRPWERDVQVALSERVEVEIVLER
jgi:uncharacterized caspase-like protein